ncbi:hypothetical protein [Hymenobacter siberiensis]|uniref:hypothetical protein n=1 Tax=Hymenobacter siberiensis TaxID=2848396 RepID=UPI001C1E6C70|nr:hypothetical protein [Hymenobacter siberiensis]
MPSSLSTFTRQLAALRQLPQPTLVEGPNIQAIFTTWFDKELRAKMGPEAYQQATAVLQQYTAAVQLCRTDKLAAALAQLQLADAELAELPAAPQAFVTLFHLSAWGNYQYKVGNATQGIALLHQGLLLSAELERQGYKLIYRRVEQLLNIVALYTQQQHHARAHNLLRNILTFAHTGQATGLLIDDWDGAALQQVRAYQEHTLDEAFAKLASQNTTYLTHPQYTDDYHYHFFFRDLLQQLHPDTYNRAILHNWLYVKESYYQNGLNSFLENVLIFVADPEIASEYGVFKANLLAQAGHYLHQQTSDTTHLAVIRNFATATLLDRRGRAVRLAA